jgi:hypothetical protein
MMKRTPQEKDLIPYLQVVMALKRRKLYLVKKLVKNHFRNKNSQQMLSC